MLGKRVGPAVAVVSLIAAGSAHAGISSDETDPKKVMQAVEDRDTGDKMTAAMVMTIKTGDRKRVRKLRVKGIETKDGEKSLMLFASPADIRNTGLLIYDYDGSKSDDQWLYLPSMRKTVRISGGDKSGAFMGSDFSYSDMTRRDIDSYDYEMVKQSTKVDGEACWMIEARPNNKRTKKETGYLKLHVWVSKDKLMPLQVKAWVRAGKKLKYLKYDEIKKVDGIWVAHQVAARTVRGKSVESTTYLELSGVAFDSDDVSSSDFSQRRLEQGL